MSAAIDVSGIQQQAMRIIAKAWADEGFKQRLLADPNGTVQAEGVAVPPGLKLVVHEDDGTKLPASTADTLYFTLPPKPGDTLSDADLEAVAGGSAAAPPNSYLANLESMTAQAAHYNATLTAGAGSGSHDNLGA